MLQPIDVLGELFDGAVLTRFWFLALVSRFAHKPVDAAQHVVRRCRDREQRLGKN